MYKKFNKQLGSFLKVTTVVVMLMALTSCHSLTWLQTKNIELRTDFQLNPDDLGRPLSMLIRLYELRSRQHFDALTLHDLTQVVDEKRVLGEDLILRHEFFLQPASQRTISLTPHQNTRYLAWVGFYRNPYAQPWRVIQPIDEVQRSGGALWVGSCGLMWRLKPLQVGDESEKNCFKAFEDNTAVLSETVPAIPNKMNNRVKRRRSER